MADLFKELLSSVDSLNEEQVNTLLSRLNEKKAGQEQETSKLVRNLETGKIVACPNCGSATIVKTGKKDGRQRYKCKDCKVSFGDTTGTLHQHSKLTKDQWLGVNQRDFIEYFPSEDCRRHRSVCSDRLVQQAKDLQYAGGVILGAGQHIQWHR